MVTIKVDSTIYSDKKQGDTFSTGWGEIKILSINVSAQTVTIMHGDADADAARRPGGREVAIAATAQELNGAAARPPRLLELPASPQKGVLRLKASFRA